MDTPRKIAKWPKFNNYNSRVLLKIRLANTLTKNNKKAKIWCINSMIGIRFMKKITTMNNYLIQSTLKPYTNKCSMKEGLQPLVSQSRWRYKLLKFKPILNLKSKGCLTLRFSILKKKTMRYFLSK